MSTTKVLQTLKRDLKSKGVTYRDLAVYLNMSEAGIKKLLSKTDISLSKLTLICELLQCSVSDVLSAADENAAQTHQFSEKQIKFFEKNRNYFHFFMKIAYEQKSPLMIQKEFNLSTRSLNIYLKKLEELELVKRHPHDRMQILGGIPVAIQTTGTALESEKYIIALEQLAKLKSLNSENLKGAVYYLSEIEKSQFLEKYKSLIMDYSLTSKMNRKKRRIVASEFSYFGFFKEGSMFKKISEV